MDSSELRTEMEKNHRASYGWALSCCSQDPMEAESVLQTVYLQILEGKAKYNGQASFKTWLFSVIRNTAAYRRRWRLLQRLRLDRYLENSRLLVAEESPDDTVYRAQVKQIFKQALAALPRRQQEVLVLVFYHDFSLKEAAEVMGISLGAARAHYERGKSRLRLLLKESRLLNESEM